jgi:DNA-binding NarL/FixJ family response regulator
MAQVTVCTSSEHEVNMRVILVDDSFVFLEALAAQLARNPLVQVIGRATNGPDGLRLAQELKPDLAIVDLAMPDMNGLEVAHGLKNLAQPPRVVMLSMYDEPEYREGAQLVGVDAYIAKKNVHAELGPLLIRLNGAGLPPAARVVGKHAAPASDYNR